MKDAKLRARALRQTIDYCQAEHGKSQRGYFSAGGWAGEQLRGLLADLENENATVVTPVALSQPQTSKGDGMATVEAEDSRPENEAQAILLGLPLRMIHRAHQTRRKQYKGIPLWSFISDVTMHGSGVSKGICQQFGWDPDADTDKAVLR